MKKYLALGALLAVAGSASAVTYSTVTVGLGGGFTGGSLVPQDYPGSHVGSSYSAVGTGLTSTVGHPGTTTWTNKFLSAGPIGSVLISISGTGTLPTKITLNSLNVYDDGLGGSPSVFALPASPLVSQINGVGAWTFSFHAILDHTVTNGRVSFGTLLQGGGTVNTVTTTAVPEPASMAALAIGGLGLLRRRRKA